MKLFKIYSECEQYEENSLHDLKARVITNQLQTGTN